MKPRINCSLIGFPDHEAILNVGGRIGAAEGPAGFRKVWQKLKGREIWTVEAQDLGDIAVAGQSLEQKHRSASQMIKSIHAAADGMSIVVGGGHDYAAPVIQGLVEAGRARNPNFKLGCINVDAHFDLRDYKPQVTSGSPFRIAIEGGWISGSDLVEFGVQSHSNTSELFAYAAKHKVQVVHFASLRHGTATQRFRECLASLVSRCDAVFVSIDLDAAAEAFAPGVSAPQAEGFTSSEMIEFCEIAGWDSKVKCLGMFELSPPLDVGDRTSRLAATAAHHFLSVK